MFIGRIDVEAETPVLWPPDAKRWLIWKDPDAGKDWRREEKGMTEDEMVGWMAALTQWTWVWVNSWSWWWTGRSGVLHPWSHKESDMTEQLNWTELNWKIESTSDFASVRGMGSTVWPRVSAFLFFIGQIFKSLLLSYSILIYTLNGHILFHPHFKSSIAKLASQDCTNLPSY